MLKIAWPLAVLVLLDSFGITKIISYVLAESITGKIRGAYLALFLCLIEIPFCMIGCSASNKVGKVFLQRVYIAHLVINILLIVVLVFPW